MRDISVALGVTTGQILAYLTGTDLAMCVSMTVGAWIVVLGSRITFIKQPN